jgi:hypothetical protein
MEITLANTLNFWLELHLFNCLLAAKQKSSKKHAPRHHWTDAEEKELRRIFSQFFEHKTTPRFPDVKKAIAISKKKGGLIHKLKNENIKKKVWNMLSKSA